MDDYIQCAGCDEFLDYDDATEGLDGEMYCPDCIAACADEQDDGIKDDWSFGMTHGIKCPS